MYVSIVYGFLLEINVFVFETCLCVLLQEKHIQDVLEVNKQFSKATEQKLIQKMEATLKNRENQLQQLTERLKEHVSAL